MNKKQVWILVALASVLMVASLIMFLGTKKKKETLPVPLQSQTEIPEAGQPRVKRMTLFFFTEKTAQMVPVSTDWTLPEQPSKIYLNFLELLFSGKEGYIVPYEGPFPLLQSFFLEPAGVLVLDFHEDILNQFPGGTHGECEFIYFVVDNICFNFPQVKKVQFLFGGNEQKTLGGHLDLERPFFPDYSYIAQ